MMEIIGNIKNYEWGKLGDISTVAQLASLNSDKFRINSTTPYAELWMGDHPSGPSIIKSNGTELSKVVKAPLPFLFKVLSIRKALSIQVHPNKSEAERLHKERPDVYKDPNHKPELAIALTSFTALCGFRPHKEIAKLIEELCPLKELLGGDKVIQDLKQNSPGNLKNTYEKLMNSKPNDIGHCIQQILNNYKQVLISNCLLEVICTVNADFPNDVGVLSLFFLNLIRLEPGEAIFLAANEIHAYLSGDCIECMACSDNVIRAGLTPKYKDVGQLISCLNYTGSPANDKYFQPQQLDDQTKLFVPPVRDFAVAEIILKNAVASYELSVLKEDSILLVLEGERTFEIEGFPTLTLKRGSIVYIPASKKVTTKSIGDNKNDFLAYVAMNNYFRQ